MKKFLLVVVAIVIFLSAHKTGYDMGYKTAINDIFYKTMDKLGVGDLEK